MKLADIDRVNDLPPAGDNSYRDPSALAVSSVVRNFQLPSSSGFIYKWEKEL